MNYETESCTERYKKCRSIWTDKTLPQWVQNGRMSVHECSASGFWDLPELGVWAKRNFAKKVRLTTSSCVRPSPPPPKKKKHSPRPEFANKLYRPSDRRLSAKVVPTFTDRGCHMVNVTDSYSSILWFLDRSRNFFLQVAPKLYSRGWVDPLPDPLLLSKFGNAENRTWSSGSVSKNSDD
jgi:hypothetical protein